ncbi:MAG: polysaccharide export protein [Rhodobacterales bacterium]|nr:polysaccharide export protein [Rhodobacterales bacterium]NCT12595.1 polysaccharide export protein [Rhodobacterales bacterium]
MTFSMTRLAGIVLCMALAGCNTPRGAGFQNEVLAASVDADGQEVAPDFAVFSVTRDTLPIIADWPATGARGYNWINRREQPASLIIAPGDTVSITVWDAEENSLITGPGQRVAQLQDMQVSSSGSVFLPFVGELRIAGMSADGARARVEERYLESVPSAQVQLAVRPGRANTANLVAGVASPGVYPLPDRDFTILGLLSQGGGVRAGMVNPQVRLMRGGEIYGTSVARLYAEPGLDTTLVGGDRVIVEEEARYFLSLGAAGSEALHRFPKDTVSALDALSIIGGVSDDRADPKGILILREYPASALSGQGRRPPQTRIVFTIDLTSADGLFSAGNFRIMPRDLVYATESPVTATRTIIGLLGASLGLAERVLAQ